jgi:hypothetical protein
MKAPVNLKCAAVKKQHLVSLFIALMHGNGGGYKAWGNNFAAWLK